MVTNTTLSNNNDNSSNSLSAEATATQRLYKLQQAKMNAIKLAKLVASSSTVPNAAYEKIHALILDIVGETFGDAAKAQVFENSGSITVFDKYADAMGCLYDLKTAEKIGNALVWHCSYDGNTVAREPVLSVIVRFVCLST